MVELITVREAARAVRLSEKQLYAAIAERQFPAVRIGRRIRIPADAVAQWVRAQIEALGGWEKLMEELKKRLEEQKKRHEGGNKMIGTGGGSVSVGTGGARTCATTLVCSGATTSAGFSVSGATGMNVAISVPGSVTLTETGGGSMAATLVSSATSLTLAGTAADAFSVGGTLNVGATQAAGAYAGTFTVTVNYQ